MTLQIPCPNCAQPVDPQTRYCNHCGVDLGLAAAIAEQAIAVGPDLPTGVPLAPELLVPRVGDYMIELGIVTNQDLQNALDYQKQKATDGNSILVGQALLELGLVDKKTLDEVITTQILQLQNALSNANRKLERRVQERTLDLQRALDRLAELNQLKSNFIANISHELRTPLTHIKGYLDLMVEEELGPLTGQQRDAIHVLMRAEGRLEQLIEDLIQFSMASRGELSLSLGRVNLENILTKATERARNKAHGKEIALSLAIPVPLLEVEADEEKIAWVLYQLLDNALKFTSPSGFIEVQAIQEDRRVTISVADTGIGIPSERLNEIFEPFHQLDGSATRRYGGTGLGLAMVWRIIDAHGSQIHVQSVEGRGTRFEFSLRCLPPDGRLAD